MTSLELAGYGICLGALHIPLIIKGGEYLYAKTGSRISRAAGAAFTLIGILFFGAAVGMWVTALSTALGATLYAKTIGTLFAGLLLLLRAVEQVNEVRLHYNITFNPKLELNLSISRKQ
jgi:hypothetical protein